MALALPPSSPNTSTILLIHGTTATIGDLAKKIAQDMPRRSSDYFIGMVDADIVLTLSEPFIDLDTRIWLIDERMVLGYSLSTSKDRGHANQIARLHTIVQ